MAGTEAGKPAFEPERFCITLAIFFFFVGTEGPRRALPYVSSP